ncbi:O-antigen ligase family protein [Empedobacter brevis]|uniref:O-antigen ligase family protein n=1 Tax=Empedobacter brevis TaxID=247 RepID=UPI003342B689
MVTVLKKVKLQKKDYNSIGLAIFLCANPLSWIAPFPNVIVIICLISSLFILFNNNLKIFINKKLFIIPFVFLLYFFTYAFNYNLEKINIYFNSFLVFGIIGLLYSSCEFSFQTFLKTVLIISIISIPGLLRVSTLTFESNMEASGYYMGISYGSLRLLIALLLAIFIFKNKFVKILILVIALLYVNFFLQYSNRGAILSFLIFFILYVLLKKGMLNVRTSLFLCFLVIIGSFFFIDMILGMKNVLDSMNLNVKAIDKMVMFNEQDRDFSNGRSKLIDLALNDISSNLITGNGIGVFDSKYGIYPHNILVQVFYEGGIFYLLLILLVFINFFRVIFSKDYTAEYKIFIIYLFFAGIFELFFSNVYWRSVFFWFFVGIMLNNKNKVKKLYNA